MMAWKIGGALLLFLFGFISAFLVTEAAYSDLAVPVACAYRVACNGDNVNAIPEFTIIALPFLSLFALTLWRLWNRIARSVTGKIGLWIALGSLGIKLCSTVAWILTGSKFFAGWSLVPTIPMLLGLLICAVSLFLRDKTSIH
jgi:hypothetical protein